MPGCMSKFFFAVPYGVRLGGRSMGRQILYFPSAAFFNSAISNFFILRNALVTRASFCSSFSFIISSIAAGVTAEEKYKKLLDGTTARYVYYGCTRGKDKHCKNKYIREEELIVELLKILDEVNINEFGMRNKLEDEIRRFNKLQKIVNGQTGKALVEENDVNIRQYAKYLLKEGSVSDKRELLGNLRSRLNYKDKRITMIEE